MGLAKVFQNAARTAMKVAGDLKEYGNYISVTDDGVTDYIEFSLPVEVLLSEIAITAATGSNIMPGDLYGTVLTSQFTVAPKKGDRLETGTGIYNVEDFTRDAAKAAYKLHLRTI